MEKQNTEGTYFQSSWRTEKTTDYSVVTDVQLQLQ